MFAKAEVRLGDGVGEGMVSKNPDTVGRRSNTEDRSILMSCIVSVSNDEAECEQSRKPGMDDKLSVKQS